MKKILIILLFSLNAISMHSQELKWNTDINKAIKISNATKKPLFLFFTGSDWCGWCIRLQKEVLKTPEFALWAAKNVVLVEVDFPRASILSEAVKIQNNGLQQVFQVQGFPTVWFATANIKNGKPNFTPLGSTGYVPGGPKAWLDVANGILKTKK